MPNIEIKAKYSDLSKAREIAQKHQTDYLGCLHQVDTYFETKQGRLKLREINGKEAQLIPYSKDYQAGPMKSSYSVLPVSDSENLKTLMDKLLGTVTVVDKKREVFLIENIRIHLDEVKGLGSFVEFEAVYSDDTQNNRMIEKTKISELMKTFKVLESDLLDKSYIDYLLS